MARERFELNREHLFEMVWSEPATKVASQLGISDVALDHFCQTEGFEPSESTGRRIETGGRHRVCGAARPELLD